MQGLEGVRVLELGHMVSAAYTTKLMADLGADVVRVDRPPVPGDMAELPPRFDFYNRNKRSVAYDLKQPESVKDVLRLVAAADVLLEGFRPGVTERLGLGPDTCLSANPKLVYARMTGWGQDGPAAREAGHDINYLALTGALHSIGDPRLPPPPPLNLIADLGGGAMYLAVGVLAAALSARSTGKGQVLDVAMVDGVVNLMSAFQAFRQHGSWSAYRGDNLVDGGAPYYGTYETKDGKWVAVGAIEPQFYAALLQVMSLDPGNLPPQNDRAQWPAMRERFATVFRTRAREEWVELASGKDACLSPVLSMDEAPHHPHMAARGSFTTFDEVLHPTPAPRFSGTPTLLRRAAPSPGQHQEEVLRGWGSERTLS